MRTLRTSRKGRNLADNAGCTIATSAETLDLIVEGVVSRLESRSELETIADALGAEFGWHFTIDDDGVYDGNLPGSPEYGLYRIVPRRAYGFGPDGLTATRWQFPKSIDRAGRLDPGIAQ